MNDETGYHNLTLVAICPLPPPPFIFTTDGLRSTTLLNSGSSILITARGTLLSRVSPQQGQGTLGSHFLVFWVWKRPLSRCWMVGVSKSRLVVLSFVHLIVGWTQAERGYPNFTTTTTTTASSSSILPPPLCTQQTWAVVVVIVAVVQEEACLLLRELSNAVVGSTTYVKISRSVVAWAFFSRSLCVSSVHRVSEHCSCECAGCKDLTYVRQTEVEWKREREREPSSWMGLPFVPVFGVGGAPFGGSLPPPLGGSLAKSCYFRSHWTPSRSRGLFYPCMSWLCCYFVPLSLLDYTWLAAGPCVRTATVLSFRGCQAFKLLDTTYMVERLWVGTFSFSLSHPAHSDKLLRILRMDINYGGTPKKWNILDPERVN